MRATLLVVAVALLGVAAADTNTNLATAQSTMNTDVSDRSTAKGSAETSIQGLYDDVVLKQQALRDRQAEFLVEQEEYWKRYATWQAAEANKTSTAETLAEKTADYDAAYAQLTGSDTSGSYICAGTVTVSGVDYVDHPCWSQQDRDNKRTNYQNEIAHIDGILADLVDGHPVDEYSEAAVAKSQLENLRAKLVDDIAYLDLMHAIQTQYVSDLEAIKLFWEGIDAAAEEHRLYRMARRDSQHAAMNNKAAEVDAAGPPLQTSLNTWNAAQKSFAESDKANRDALAVYRAKLNEILKDLDTQAVTAKSALYVERGGYASAPPVNLRKDFTMEVWVYFDPTKHDHASLPIISQARVVGADDTKFVFQLKLRGGPRSVEQEGSGEYQYYFWDFRMGSPESPGYAVRLWGNEYQPRGWTHVAVSVKTISGNPHGYLFVDGVQEYTKQFSATRWSSPEPMLFGKIVDSAGTRFSQCAFDEFRVYAHGESDASIINARRKTAVDPTDTDLRIYLRFDEKYDNPASVPSSLQTRIIDSSVNRLDGTFYYPTALSGVAAKHIDSSAFSNRDDYTSFSEYGVHLDSKPEHQNYVAVPTQDLTGTFTIEAWLKHKTGASTDHYPKVAQPVRDGWTRDRFVFTLEMKDGVTAGNCFYQFKMGNCITAEEHDAGTCGYAIEVQSDEFAGCQDWHHVAVMVSANDVAKIFVDGVCGEEGAEPTSSGTCVKRLDPTVAATRLTSNEPIQFGRLVDDIQFNSVEGTVDEIRIWNVARTQEQLAEYMFRTLPPSLWDQQGVSNAHLTVYYQLEEPAGHRQVYDRVVRTIADLKDGSQSLQTGYVYGTRVRASKSELWDQSTYAPAI